MKFSAQRNFGLRRSTVVSKLKILYGRSGALAILALMVACGENSPGDVQGGNGPSDPRSGGGRPSGGRRGSGGEVSTEVAGGSASGGARQTESGGTVGSGGTRSSGGGASTGGVPMAGAGGLGSSCAPGSYDADGDDTTPCLTWTACVPGESLVTPGTPTVDATCAECPIGTFSAINNAQTCTLCPAGSFSSSVGASSCKPCPEGTTSEPGSIRCSECPLGSNASSTGSMACTPCEAGSAWSVDSGACKLCEPGRYSSEPGALECSPCEPGTFNAAEGSTSCAACAEGTYSAASGSVACSDCPPGSYSSALGCKPCSPGTSAPGGNQSSCTICGPGTYAPVASAASCLVCPSRTFTEAAQATSCEPWQACDWNERIENPGTASTDIACSRDSSARMLPYDNASKVSQSSDGSVYISGKGAGDATFVIKYDASGNLEWTQEFISVDVVTGIQAEGVDKVHVYGYSQGMLEGALRPAFVRTYASLGALIETRTFLVESIAAPKASWRSDQGELYVGGSVNGQLPGQLDAGAGDAFLRKYGANGAEEWTLQFGTYDGDIITDVSVDNSGVVGIVGRTWGTFPGEYSPSKPSSFVGRVSPNGVLLWIHQTYDGGAHVAVDEAGMTYIGGGFGVRSYDSAGALINTWGSSYETLRDLVRTGPFVYWVGTRNEPSALYLDDTAYVYSLSAGTSLNLKLGNRGSNHADGFTRGPSGYFFVVGYTKNGLIDEYQPYFHGYQGFVMRRP
jgi:hypothetical protein